MKRFFYSAGLISTLFFLGKAHSGTAILGGYSSPGGGSDDANFVLVNQLSVGSTSSSIPVTGVSLGEVSCIVIDANGGVIFGGFTSEFGAPLVQRLKIGSSITTSVATPLNQTGQILSIAITPDGTAILGGINNVGNNGYPLVYRLSAASNSAVYVPTPSGNNEGFIITVLARPDGSCILGGEDDTNSIPLVYKWENGILTLFSNPNLDGGYILTGAVASDGTVLLGGHDTTTSAPLIYRVSGNTVEVIATPGGDLGGIGSIAIDSDGTAILAGSTDSNSPLVYRLLAGASSVSSIAIPGVDEGFINCISIGSNNEALLGGQDTTTNFPLIYRLPANSETLSIIAVPAIEGQIFCVAIDSNGTAIFGGTTNADAPIIYSLPLEASTATVVASVFPPDSVFGQFECIAIYDPAPLYDFNRLKAIYNQQLDKTQIRLGQSGL